MKKFVLSLLMLTGLLSCISAKTIFDAAYDDDIKSFEKLLKQPGVLDVTTNSGMPLQIAIAQFSDENFDIACKILSKKQFDFDKPAKSGMTLLYLLTSSLSVNKIKTLLNYGVDVNKEVDKILPIQATQFSTYPFHTEQKIDPELFEKEKQIHEMLIEKGSKPFSYIPANMYYFGNFLFSFSYVLYQSNKMINPNVMNRPEYFNIEEKNNRTIASFKYELLKDLFNEYGYRFKDVDISYHTENILQNINKALASPKKCYIMACTSKDSTAPNQWVMIKSFEKSVMEKQKVSKESEKFTCFNSCTLYDYAEYHIKDISEIIVITQL